MPSCCRQAQMDEQIGMLMSIRIIDTYPDIMRFTHNSTQYCPISHRQYLNNISPELCALCTEDASSYQMETQILPVIHRELFDQGERIHQAHRSLQSIDMRTIERRMNELFDIELDVTIILYLGLCNGAGWATQLDKRQTILLGVEKIAELGWHTPERMHDLICHEIAHLILDFIRKNMREMPAEMQQLYKEGFATRASQLLYTEGFFHQDDGVWLSFCQEHIDKIKEEFYTRLQSNVSTAAFFGDWNLVMGQHNLGYYLGYDWIKQMQARYSIKEIALLSPDLLACELSTYLTTPASTLHHRPTQITKEIS